MRYYRESSEIGVMCRKEIVKSRFNILEQDYLLLIVLFQLIPFLRCQLHTLYPEKVETAASKINRLATPMTESMAIPKTGNSKDGKKRDSKESI